MIYYVYKLIEREMLFMKVKNESVAVVKKETVNGADKYLLRYTLNMVDYGGIWMYDFGDHLTINVTSAKDGAIYWEKCSTFEQAEAFISKVFIKMDKLG